MITGKWFHGSYLVDTLIPGRRVALFGKVEFDNYAGELTMMHPEFELLTSDDDEGESALHVGRIVPIYEAAGKVNTRILRNLLWYVLNSLPGVDDPMPVEFADGSSCRISGKRFVKLTFPRRNRTCGC